MEPATPYYGDLVRKLFILCGLVILITLPFLKTLIPGPIYYSLTLVIVLAFFAGMTNRKFKKILVVDVIISGIGFIVFAYQAIMHFIGLFDLFFVTNLILAVIFLFAFYWSIKTARGLKFPSRPVIDTPRKFWQSIVNANEDTPATPHKELTEEEIRRKRFLDAEE